MEGTIFVNTMKKNILILHFNMELGGAETSLLGLLDAIDYEKYTVDLLLYAREGILLSEINSNVRILPEIIEYKALTKSISNNFKEGFWKIGISRCYAKLRSKVSRGSLKTAHNYKQYFHKLCMPYLPEINKNYDLAISFNDPHYIIGKKVNAKVKMCWFHTDASHMRFYEPIEKEMWTMCDYIVNVSEECKKEFDKKHIYTKQKSIVIENILSKKMILRKSLKSVDKEIAKDGKIKLLSIGRFSYQKNFDNVPDICKKIRNQGIDVKWYLIGYGGEEILIRKKIEEAGMQEYVIILGKKENPYPYIKACDIYVQPSRYEGKCVAVREAQMLGKPVIITNYETSASQLENGVDGIIVPMDNQSCADGIIRLIRNKELQKKLVFNMEKRDYTNANEINKIYQLIK